MMFPVDKIYHMLAGAACFVVSLLVLLIAGVYNPEGALAISALAGILKEISDAVSNSVMKSKGLPPEHDVDFFDFLATLIGGLFCFGIVELITLFV